LLRVAEEIPAMWKVSGHPTQGMRANDAAKRKKYHPRKAHLGVDTRQKAATVWRLKG
jgi:hypothetical protein